jgi:hypothetical protein
MTILQLATATASEEISDLWAMVALVSFVLSAILGSVAIVGSFFPKLWLRWFHSIVLFAVLSGLIAVAFVTYVYVIDYAAVDGDGTKASPPIWEPLAIPALPIAASLLALFIEHRRRQNKLML